MPKVTINLSYEEARAIYFLIREKRQLLGKTELGNTNSQYAKDICNAYTNVGVLLDKFARQLPARKDVS